MLSLLTLLSPTRNLLLPSPLLTPHGAIRLSHFSPFFFLLFSCPSLFPLSYLSLSLPSTQPSFGHFTSMHPFPLSPSPILPSPVSSPLSTFALATLPHPLPSLVLSSSHLPSSPPFPPFVLSPFQILPSPVFSPLSTIALATLPRPLPSPPYSLFSSAPFIPTPLIFTSFYCVYI